MPASTGYEVPNIAALRAVPATLLISGFRLGVTSKTAWYMYSSVATEPDDGDLVVQPTEVTGAGRWYKTKATIAATEVTGLTAYIDNLPPKSSLASNGIGVTTGVLGTNQSSTHTISLSGAGVFTKLETSSAARVRVYLNNTYATADLGRLIDVELTGEHGCLLEAVTTSGNLVLDLSPIVFYVATTSLSVTITNLALTSQTVTCLLTRYFW